ncbi:MAG: tetratricopeptide repeat protein, partial [Cytophagales bacterium]|nr:tetratricopeptide repeat protein [Cytophagales bacterium]
MELKNQDKRTQLEVLMNLFISYTRTDLDSALYYAVKINEAATLLGDTIFSVRAENAIGWVYEQKGEPGSAVNHYLIGLNRAKNNGIIEWEKKLLNSLGVIHNDYGEYDKALKYHFQSLDLREKGKDQLEIAISINNIGLVYYRIKDYLKAIEYFKRSIAINEEMGDNRLIESTLVNLGLCYSGLGQHEEALNYFTRVLEMCEVGCQDQIKIASYTGAGLAKFWSEDYEEAEIYFNFSNEVLKNTGLNSNEVINYYYLAEIRLKQGALDEAIFFLNESQSLAIEKNLREWIKNGFQLYGEVYSEYTNFELAYQFQKKYDSLNSLILNEGVIRNLAEIQADYLERENLQTIASKNEEISRRTTLLILSVIIIFLISVILFILYRINQLRKKANQQLSEANAIIEQQNKELTDVNNVLEEKVKERTKELKDTNAALLKSNTDLDNFIYKTSHDIRGPLATLQGMCNIALMDIEEPKSVDYFEKIGRTADRLNEILSKLLVINQINNSLITSNPIDVKRLIKDIL